MTDRARRRDTRRDVEVEARTEASGRQFRSFYGRAWRRARLDYLMHHPLCVYCEQAGHVREAEHVDHIVPHRGNNQLFWDRDNWQSLCAEHHNSTKQREEKTGIVEGCDVDGQPLQAGNHWK